MSTSTVPGQPAVPEQLQGLVDLALDVRWTWSHSADMLWARLSPEVWERTHSPWHILQSIPPARLQEFARDADFVDLLRRHVDERAQNLSAPSWYAEHCQNMPPGAPSPSPLLGQIAYFSMEFGLTEALPIYSGGLGILAGDYLKCASDMGVPLVGIGILWQQGYFRQALSSTGEQIELFPFNDPGQLPVSPLRDSRGEWVSVNLEFPRRTVQLRVWEVRAGRVMLYLLDANDLMNSAVDRGITSELYGGGPEVRLQQELILGIGGWRVLRALGIEAEICHLNEGHAAFAVLERARTYMEDTGVDFEEALDATRAGNLFTTHTSVEAGFDRFPVGLVREYLGDYAKALGISMDRLLALGAADRTDGFNMAFLAIRGSGAVNGVSRLHSEVSRRLFQPLFPRWPQEEVPISHVTNGVHVPSWDSAEADTLWTRICGKDRWLGDTRHLTDLMRQVSDEELWTLRNVARRNLVATARDHLRRQGPIAGSLEALGDDISCLCDPGVFTIGFARRFASYKRVDLLLHDVERLERILCGPDSRTQLILAGKAHPADRTGKAMIKEWTDFIARCNVRPHVIFLVDYDMDLAEHLVHGVDLWINTPRRPWEASGTSGMKVLANGGLNLSELDGWWAEAYSPEVGWALGDGLEHDHDPAVDAAEAERLYDLLENEVIREFYDRDSDGIPRRWIARVRESMARLTPRFSTNRMMADYLDRYYLPGAVAYRQRVGSLAAGLGAWRGHLDTYWGDLAFLNMDVKTGGGPEGSVHSFVVRIRPGRVRPDAIRVEVYADPGEIHALSRVDGTPDGALDVDSAPHGGAAASEATLTYRASIPALRPFSDYTPRVVPWYPGAQIPLESSHILWYR
jgi:glycogen phosphorylase